MSNIKLVFNGQVIWSMENFSSELWQLLGGESYEGLHNKRRIVIPTTASNSPALGLGDNTVSPIALNQHKTTLIVNGVIRTSKALVNGDNRHLLTNKVNFQGDNYYYAIPISEILSKNQGQGYFNGADLSKQTLDLSFSVITAYDNINVKREKVNTKAIIYLTYTYKSVYQFDGEKVLLVM